MGIQTLSGEPEIARQSFAAPQDAPTQSAAAPKKSLSADCSLGERISFLLNAPETLARLKKFPQNDRDRVLWTSVQYCILFPDATDLLPYLDALDSKGFGNLATMTRHIADRLNLIDPNSREAERRICEYFLHHYTTYGYFFHSFNGCFEESIRKNGIDPAIRPWEWDELRRMDAIGKACGARLLVGWGLMGCEGKISVADDASNLYRYALSSPEWFSQFVACGSHIPNNPPYDKTAFYRRDYLAAKTNMTELCKRMRSYSAEDIEHGKRTFGEFHNITLEEEVEILAFFEKYWAVFATEKSAPKCALIPQFAYGDPDWLADYVRERFKRGDSLSDCLSLAMSRIGCNAKMDERIPPEDIVIIDLPDHDMLLAD